MCCKHSFKNSIVRKVPLPPVVHGVVQLGQGQVIIIADTSASRLPVAREYKGRGDWPFNGTSRSHTRQVTRIGTSAASAHDPEPLIAG